ncbi:hypothetical protein [Streptomyces sp. NPDC047829]|uniref:AMP-binding enzyme n=1 Tax=Streptomyces sp. NPDC047829 TaxID=3154609 RepID=UPI00340C81CF
MTDRQKDVTPRTPVPAPAPPGHRPALSTVWADAPLDGRACVVGVPDERWGEAVKAVVVPHPGGGRRDRSRTGRLRTRARHHPHDPPDPRRPGTGHH